MGSYEDDRIRRKNKKWEDLKRQESINEVATILSRQKGTQDENSDDKFVCPCPDCMSGS